MTSSLKTFVVFLVTSVNMSGIISTTERLGNLTSLTLTSEGFPVLDALTIVTRSMLNCKVFGYYGGIQKLTALMKGILLFIFLTYFLNRQQLCYVFVLMI